eukprot:161608-Amphidinium_carterae.1
MRAFTHFTVMMCTTFNAAQESQEKAEGVGAIVTCIFLREVALPGSQASHDADCEQRTGNTRAEYVGMYFKSNC